MGFREINSGKKGMREREGVRGRERGWKRE